MNMKISPMHKTLANLLYSDSNLKIVDIANVLNISRQTASKYYKTLLETLIERKTRIANTSSFRNFYVEIKSNPEEPDIVSKLLRIDGIRSMDGIIGAYSLIAEFSANSKSHFNYILHKIDSIISTSKFQHYRLIDCLYVFKMDGFAIKDNIEQINHEKENIFSIKIKPEAIRLTDFPYKFYLQIMPKELSKYDYIAKEILTPKENITDLFRTGQEYGIMAVVRTNSINQYREFIESLYSTKLIQDSISTFVLDEKLSQTFKPFLL